MGSIVSTTVVRTLAIDLGWDNLNTAEIEDWLAVSGIDPAGVVAFMRAVLAAPDGISPDNIVGVDAAQGPYIAAWFRDHGCVF
jgi:hypothetical protein